MAACHLQASIPRLGANPGVGDKAAIFCRFVFSESLAALAIQRCFCGWQIKKSRYNETESAGEITSLKRGRR